MDTLFIPVILGTVRQGRLSEPVANFILEQVQQQADVETELIDIRALSLPMDDAGPQAKIPALSETMLRADGYIIVVPEYNHTYPGLLKHMLDLNRDEYLHKSVGLCTVSAGPFGGIRAGEALLPTLKAFGLGTIVPDLNFGNVKTLVDEAFGKLTEDAQTAYKRRFGRFMAELLWLTQTLKYGRENFAQGS
ncbi:MAG: NAD(P)H-dependent oxidoreductase [Spirulina sp. SIO3F2]|nr:NAD(P)H-dependent oxidoreductase [Spirulina sp. SIO3F2]